MRRFLSALLALMLLPMLPVRAAGLTVTPESTEIHPYQAVRIAFETESAGRADVLLTDAAGATVSVVAEGFDAWAGHNELYWNGTYQNQPAPEGAYYLTVRQGTDEASVPVTVGAPGLQLSGMTVADTVVGENRPLTVSFTAGQDATAVLSLVSGENRTELLTQEVSAGKRSLVWDGRMNQTLMPAGDYTVALQLRKDGAVSTEEHIGIRIEAAPAEAPAEPADAEEEEPTAVYSEASAAEEAADFAAGDEAAAEADDLIVSDTDPANVANIVQIPDQRSFTPSTGSAYPVTENDGSFWTTPMDITDEEAVWNMLTAPVTVVDTGKKNGEKRQIYLRQEPSEDARPVGVVTNVTQGVRVIEKLDSGWTLIECYSSSFHDTKVPAWNMLVHGYVPSKYLKEVKPSTEMGLVIDKLTQRLYVFREGKLFSTLLISTGISNKRQPYNETRSGEFLFASRVGEFRSDNLRCGLAIRFNSGDLLHEVPHLLNRDGSKNYSINEPKLGTRASHGCIRVQRKRSPEGVNMQWIWEHYKRNTKLVIWEDFQGRQIPVPDDDMPLYYNPAGGSLYHSQPTCYSVKKKNVTFESFTYGQLDEEPFSKLKRCDYCAAALRREEIEAINAAHLPGGDHDPVLTEARQKYLNSLAE